MKFSAHDAILDEPSSGDSQYRNIGKPNKYKEFGSDKSKGPKQDSQNWPQDHQYPREENLSKLTLSKHQRKQKGAVRNGQYMDTKQNKDNKLGYWQNENQSYRHICKLTTRPFLIIIPHKSSNLD